MYLLLPVLNVGFLEVATMWDPKWFPAARPFSHGRKLRNKHRQSNTEKMGKWHAPQTQHEVVTHECSQAYPKQKLENYCKKYQRHVRNHSGLRCCTDTKNAQLHAEQTHSTEQVHRCFLNDRRHHRGLEQLKRNLDVCREKEEHKHVRPTAQGRTRGATTTIVCQTHGPVHIVPQAWQQTRPHQR